MPSDAVITATKLLVWAIAAAIVYAAWRLVVARPIGRHWTIRLPIIFAAYHLSWLLVASSLATIFGQGIHHAALYLNPVHALYMKHEGLVQQFLRALHPWSQDQTWNVVVIAIVVIAVSTGLWVPAGLLIGTIMDVANKHRVGVSK